jgi:hypothetical protein
MTDLVPAPWTLTGDGLMLFYRFPKNFILENGFIPPERRDSFIGGIGAVMIVDYRTSNVGPYGELLFIPGQFQFGSKRYYSITKIDVSTMISVVNGRVNWAIPKEQAVFDIQNEPETFSVSKEGKPFFSLTAKSSRLKLPFNTAWSPIKFSLGQLQDGSLYVTTPTAKGSVHPACILDIHVNPVLFPDIGQFRPLAAFRARNFTMTFPLAHIAPFGSGIGAIASEHP